MNSISHITWAQTRCSHAPGEQTTSSKALRTTMIVLGILLTIGSLLALAGSPGLTFIGRSGEWALFSLGMVAIALAANLQVVREESDPYKQLTSSQFTVKKVPRDKWEKLSREAYEWKGLAVQRYRESNADEVFESSGLVLNDIYKKLGQVVKGIQSNEGEPWTDALVCEDATGQSQAIALIDEKKNQLAYIATHPFHVRHELNGETRVRGAATQIILALALNALKKNCPIRLKSLDSAVPFYERMHFQIDNERWNPLERGILLTLTVKRIKELIAQGTPPFNQIQL